MKQVGNTILAKGVNHILAKRDNSAWPKGAKLSGFSTANYLIIRMFIGGVNIASNDSDVVALEIVSLKYVAKRRFITHNSEISTCKDSENLETEWQKQQLFSKQHQKSFKS